MTVLGSFVTAVLVAAATGDSAIVLDERKQLFLDDYLIASMDNVDRRIQQAVKHPNNPVLAPTEPWEGTVAILYGSVIYDDDRYRMWYYAGGNVCYAESADGVHWDKPALCLVEVEGRKTNIILKRDPENPFPHFYAIFGVQKDPREKDPSRRYKMGVLSLQRDYEGPRQDPFHGGQRRGLGVAASPDGIHWNVLDDWSTEAICDGGTPATRPVLLKGSTVHVNAESDFGEITIEALHQNGEVLAKSRPIQTDALDAVVEWESGSLQSVAGPVNLRITLKNAQLFSI